MKIEQMLEAQTRGQELMLKELEEALAHVQQELEEKKQEVRVIVGWEVRNVAGTEVSTIYISQ